jgi:hypothetical protein
MLHFQIVCAHPLGILVHEAGNLYAGKQADGEHDES